MSDPIREAYLAQLAELLAGTVSRDEFWRFSDAYERGRAAAWRHGQRISIPSHSMEQEFQNYHRMGYNKGRADLLAEQRPHRSDAMTPSKAFPPPGEAQRDAWEQVGLEADALSAIVQSLQMPLPDSMHVGALRNILPEMIQRLRKAVVDGTGENPWETEP